MNRCIIPFLIGLFMSIINFLPARADNDKTELTIQNESFSGVDTGEIYRNLTYNVSLMFIPELNLIEIYHYGIGDADIYLLDYNNNVIREMQIYEGNSIDSILICEDVGSYTLVIISPFYYGQASFQIIQ